MRVSLKSTQPYDMVVIIGPDHPADSIVRLEDYLKSTGLNFKIVGDGKRGVTLEEIDEVLKSTADYTNINYWGHGTVHNEAHYIDITGNVILTATLLERNKNSKGIRHVSSCHAGFARDVVGVLNENQPVFFNSEEDLYSFVGENLKGIADQASFMSGFKALFKRYPNAEEMFEWQIAKSAESSIFSVVVRKEIVDTTDGIETINTVRSFKTTAPNEKLQTMSHEEHLKNQIEEFRFFRKYVLGQDKSTFTDLSGMLFHKDIVSRYKKSDISLLRNRASTIHTQKFSSQAFFMNACTEGDLQTLKDTLEIKEAELDINYINHAGESGLKIAYDKGHHEVVKHLLKIGVKVDQAGEDTDTAMIAASKKNDIASVELFLKHGADINRKDTFGDTALLIAVKNGLGQLAHSLVTKGADIHEEDSNGKTPLDIARQNNDQGMVKFLERRTPPATPKQSTEANLNLHRAAKENKVSMAELLIESGEDVNESNDLGETPLYTACEYGNLEMVKLLIEKGADVKKRTISDNTALHISARNGYLDIVKTLVASGAKITKQNQKNEMPIGLSARSKHDNISAFLLKEWLKLYPPAKTSGPLNKACSEGHLDMAWFFIKEGINIHEVNPYTGETPFYAACKNGNTDIIKLLLKNGEDINYAVNDAEDTYLHMAVKNGDKAAVICLLENGADIEKTNLMGLTPLQLACAGSYPEIVSILAEKTEAKNIDKENVFGESPLLIACKNNKPANMKAILSKWDIDVNRVCSNGQTLFTKICLTSDIAIAKCFIGEYKITPGTITPLIAAAATGKEEVVDLFLSRVTRAENLIKKYECATPIHLVTDKETVTCQFGKDGKTAAEIARANGFYSISKKIEDKYMELRSPVKKIDREAPLINREKTGSRFSVSVSSGNYRQ
jgi:ankyrin repeat protein